MSSEQRRIFFRLFRFNKITRNDCSYEDRYVSDTRLALYERYLFCIVDTVDDISSVTSSGRVGAGAGARGHATSDGRTYSTAVDVGDDAERYRHETVNDASAASAAAGAWITKNLNILLFERGVVSVHLQVRLFVARRLVRRSARDTEVPSLLCGVGWCRLVGGRTSTTE